MRKRKRYILLVLLLVIAGVVVARRMRGPRIPAGSYLLLDIRGAYAEGPPQDLLATLLRRRERTMIDLLALIRAAQADQRITGVIARINALEIGWAKVQDVRDALLEFKKSSKPLVALLEQEVSGSNREYYLASAADRVYLAPAVTAPLNGLAMQFLFLGGLWEKLDVDMHVEKIREYKTAGDMIANKEMTEAHREMANSLLDSLNEQFVIGLAQGRGLAPDAVRAVIDRCPVAPAEFEAARLSDGTKYLQDLRQEIGEGKPLVELKDYGQVNPRSVGIGVGPKVGVVYGAGAITTGEGGTGVQGQMLGAYSVGQALKEAADDEDVRAIVFRVDSPGGSALASDLVWRATQAARQKKPVIVSMSDVAASGGYYIAAGANRIVAQPATLTGSIGVVLARPNIRGLLARAGIKTEAIGRGKFAQIENLTAPLDEEGRGKLVAGMNHIYDVFVDRVATGRGMTPERVNEIGRGRVWTGVQAKENGLVDELGGFMTAIQAAKHAAGIEPSKEVELVFYPKRKGMLERISELFGARAAPDLPSSWQVALRAVALPFEEGSLLALMPELIEIR